MAKLFNKAQRCFSYFQEQIEIVFSSKKLQVVGTATWWNKTLYFVCLTDPELFSILKNWKAYPKGPVSIESYQTFQNMSTIIGHFYTDNEEPTDFEKERIRNAILKLLENKDYLKISENTEKLVELSHRLYIWQSAYPLQDQKLKFDEVSLSVEKYFFDKELKKITAGIA